MYSSRSSSFHWMSCYHYFIDFVCDLTPFLATHRLVRIADSLVSVHADFCPMATTIVCLFYMHVFVCFFPQPSCLATEREKKQCVESVADVICASWVSHGRNIKADQHSAFFCLLVFPSLIITLNRSLTNIRFFLLRSFPQFLHTHTHTPSTPHPPTPFTTRLIFSSTNKTTPLPQSRCSSRSLSLPPSLALLSGSPPCLTRLPWW